MFVFLFSGSSLFVFCSGVFVFGAYRKKEQLSKVWKFPTPLKNVPKKDFSTRVDSAGVLTKCFSLECS